MGAGAGGRAGRQDVWVKIKMSIGIPLFFFIGRARPKMVQAVDPFYLPKA